MTTTTGAESPPHPDAAASGRRTDRRRTVAGLVMAMFLAALEMTVVSTAMPTVVTELGGLDRYGWVFTVYLLASTVTVPMFGKLADRAGRKRVLLGGLVAFVAGSAACGLAPSMTALIVARAVQGLGAGAIQPVSLTVVGDLFSPSERGRVQGVFGAVWGVAGLAGPLAGAWIVRALSWRWVFWINLPFGLLAAALIAGALHEAKRPPSPPLDVAGALLLSCATTLVLVAGGTAWIAWAIPAAALLVAVLARVEARAADPVFPVALFRRPLLASASAVGTLFGGAMLGIVTYVPLFVQGVQRRSPSDAGLAITPMVVAWPIASVIAGRLLPRFGARPLVTTGLAISAVSSALLAALLVPDASPWVPRVLTALFGLGAGLTNVALVISVQSSVAWEQRGVATASTMFFRTIGGALVVAAAGRVIALALGETPAALAAATALLGPTHGRGVDPSVLARVSAELVAALAIVLRGIAAVSALAFVAGLAVPSRTAAASHRVP